MEKSEAFWGVTLLHTGVDAAHKIHSEGFAIGTAQSLAQQLHDTRWEKRRKRGIGIAKQTLKFGWYHVLPYARFINNLRDAPGYFRNQNLYGLSYENFMNHPHVASEIKEALAQTLPSIGSAVGRFKFALSNNNPTTGEMVNDHVMTFCPNFIRCSPLARTFGINHEAVHGIKYHVLKRLIACIIIPPSTDLLFGLSHWGIKRIEHRTSSRHVKKGCQFFHAFLFENPIALPIAKYLFSTAAYLTYLRLQEKEADLGAIAALRSIQGAMEFIKFFTKPAVNPNHKDSLIGLGQTLPWWKKIEPAFTAFLGDTHPSLATRAAYVLAEGTKLGLPPYQPGQ